MSGPAYYSVTVNIAKNEDISWSASRFLISIIMSEPLRSMGAMVPPSSL